MSFPSCRILFGADDARPVSSRLGVGRSCGRRFGIRFRPEVPRPCPLPAVGHDVGREDRMKTIDKADEAQLLATIDRWIEREVAPRVKEFDHADKWPAEIVEQMKELGLFGATIPQEYGGLGLSAWTYAQIVIKVASIWMAPSGIFN
eukprot:gene21001-28817_t